MPDIFDLIGAGLFGVPTKAKQGEIDQDRAIRNRYIEQQTANMQLAPQELALRGREVGVGERAQDLSEQMAPHEIGRIGALTRGLEAEAKTREQELSDLQNPGASLANLIKGLYEGLGVELPPELGGPKPAESAAVGGGAESSPVMGAASMAVQRMLKGRSGGLPAIPGLEGLTGNEVQPSFLSSGMSMPAGGLVGSPTRELAAAMHGLPMSDREQVMDAFKGPLARVQQNIGQFPGATDADLQSMLRNATMGAAQSALSLARDIQTKLDANKAWLSRNIGYVHESLRYTGAQLPDDADSLYRLLGAEQVNKLRDTQSRFSDTAPMQHHLRPDK